VLMILRPTDDPDERYVVMTEQPRIPAGCLRFMEIPAGMIDGDKKLAGKAAKEIKEETGLTILEDDLVNMTELALKSAEVNKNLQAGMYPSPGGSDEYIPLFLWEKLMSRMNIEDLKDKLTGERWQDEMITLKLVKYEELWKEGARDAKTLDAKTLAAWALYEGLRREGKLLRRNNK
jgi:ADP-sugar diphosphatase